MTPQHHPSPPRLAYVDRALGFTVTAPDGWLVDSSGQQGAAVVFRPPGASAGFQPSLNVTVQPLGGLTADEFLLLVRLQVKQIHGRDVLPERVAGGAYVLGWAMTAPAGPLALRQKIFIRDGRAFVLTATALAEQAEVYRADFDQALASFAPLRDAGPPAAG